MTATQTFRLTFAGNRINVVGKLLWSYDGDTLRDHLAISFNLEEGTDSGVTFHLNEPGALRRLIRAGVIESGPVGEVEHGVLQPSPEFQDWLEEKADLLSIDLTIVEIIELVLCYAFDLAV